MSDVNIQMKQRNASNGWDNLYPKTKGANVTLNSGTTTIDDHVNNSNIHMNKTGDTMTGALVLSGDPTQALHAATKQYVDAVKQGLDIKDSVKVATTANITLSGTQTIDSIAVVAGDRVLVKDQTTATQNGIYIVGSGSWSRASDFDGSGSDVTSGAFTFVEQGTVNGAIGYVLTSINPITIGTTSLTFSPFSGAGQVVAGTGLSKSGNTLNLTNTGVTASTYKSVTVDAQGRVTGGSNPTTLSGYGITDATPSSHVGSTGTAHGVATGSVNGFMSSSDYTKLSGISSNATATASSTTNGNIKINGVETQVYVHPSDSNTRHATDTQIATWNAKQNAIPVNATDPSNPSVGDLFFAIV